MAFDDVWAQLRSRAEACLRQFEQSPPTPVAVYALEQELRGSCPICAQAEAARTCLEPLTKLLADVSGWGPARPPEASATTL
jgi:hypothetical protein